MRQPHLNPTQKVIASSQSQTKAIAQPLQGRISQSPTHPIEELQSAIGNRAVNQLLANQPTVQAKLMFRGLSRELVIQPKLAIGAVGDKYEQEADFVAEKVIDRIHVPQTERLSSQPIQQHNTPNSPVIQRYQQSTTSYEIQDTDLEILRPFKSQSIDPVITPENKIRYQTQEEYKPRVYFSDDGTIAINKAKGREAKEFFAVQDVIDNSNNALAKQESAVQLQGHSKTYIKGADDQKLLRVTPGIRTKEADPHNFDALASFGTSICIDVAQKVMGNFSRSRGTTAIFQQSPKHAEYTESLSVGDTGSSEVYKLADFLTQADRDLTPDKLHAAISTKESVDAASENYGRQMSSRAMTARAEALGINQFANPEVGEGFATFSTRPRSGKKTWGYHYAGVVAKSLDGKDSVTLENYNRSGDIKALLAKVYRRMMNENKRIIRNKIRELQRKANRSSEENYQLTDLQDRNNISRRLQAVILTLQQNEGKAKADAEKAYKDITDVNAGAKWFFHLYGSGRGQSFHEQAIKSDYFKNPLTLRVRKSDPKP
jgi:hypothetical protein